jgi:hypothetical protein
MQAIKYLKKQFKSIEKHEKKAFLHHHESRLPIDFAGSFHNILQHKNDVWWMITTTTTQDSGV